MSLNKLFVLLLLILSAVFLTVIQPPVSFSVLAFVALVPFIVACIWSEKLWPLLISSYIVSLIYWLVNLYFLIPVTAAGWVTSCIYLAVLWPLVAASLRFCQSKKIPLLVSVPILFVGAERLQGFFLGGFFWRFLAHSQFENLIIIQIADIFGAAGVSFLVALVNGLIAEFIISTRRNKIFTRGFLIKTAVVCFLLAATIYYGRCRLMGYWKPYGLLVSAVQSNIPQSVKESARDSNEVAIETFNKIAADSNSAADAGAVLVVWPETMVPAYLDERLLAIVDTNSMSKYFHNRLCAMSKGRSFLLVGATGVEPIIREDNKIEAAAVFNSAFLYMPDGIQSVSQYNKIHLVPFGEYVPFRKTFPPLYRLLMKLTPYDFDYSLDAGNEYTVFQITRQADKTVYKFSVMICYEDTVPEIARRFVLDKNGRKRVDWLLNISNDGWFVKFTDDRVRPSAELAQHASICVFRAVENRVSVLRSVNTGISCLIDSRGKIRDDFVAGSLPKKALERQGMAGWFADILPIDKRVTIFSRYGQWLDGICASLLFLAAVLAAGSGLYSRKQTGKMKMQ